MNESACTRTPSDDCFEVWLGLNLSNDPISTVCVASIEIPSERRSWWMGGLCSSRSSEIVGTNPGLLLLMGMRHDLNDVWFEARFYFSPVQDNSASESVGYFSRVLWGIVEEKCPICRSSPFKYL